MLHVVAVVDGRAGHDKQTFGLIAALRRYQLVTVTTVQVDLSLWGKITAFIQFLFPFLAPLRKQERQADLIVCTGGKTHFPALMRKRKYGLPVYTCMAPGFGFRFLFDLCFVPEHDGLAASANIVPTLGPPNLSINNGKHCGKRGLILVGGEDKNSHFWQEDRLLENIKKLVECGRRQWIISSSPRTPESTARKLSALAEETSGLLFFDYRQTSDGWVERQYQQAEVAWITSDSVSMIYEALTAGCKVGLFPMKWKKGKSKFAENERLLQQRRLVITFDQWQKGAYYIQAEEFNEAQRCADRIMEKWWAKNLL